ncbi:hypothetical protein MRX96_032801 [Rhipicephalus microplus]|uniref:Synaptic plasticity regulator PANTS n=1 Tax=Rhipicephalus microplus TaxID=6941 RepID=A0A9J6EYU5_RHIMP|nr:UPF0545 protein C22orf39 homolog [Rhipicephalus microplus]KAH8039391.1 hypothetical protein HPB51_006411 [Rhipicephalus microplus]
MATLPASLRTETANVVPKNVEGIPRNAWMVRPCEWYSEELSDCKSIRGRFHQYFIDGTTLDCSQWRKDFDNCLIWRKNKDVDALNAVVKSEEKRKHDRLKASRDNDVWQLRSEPPKDWNAPVPEWMAKKFEQSYIAATAKKEQEGNSSCCIS